MTWDLKRRFFLAFGHFFALLWLAAIFLPLMPSEPFLLLACWCYARGSPKIHAAILKNKWVGPALKNWENGRTISRRAKIYVAIFLPLWVVYACFLVQIFVVRIAIALVVTAILVYILFRPSPKP